MSNPYYIPGGNYGAPPPYSQQSGVNGIYTSPYPAGQFMSVLPSVPPTVAMPPQNNISPYATSTGIYTPVQPPYAPNMSQPTTSGFYTTAPNNPYNSNAPYATMSVLNVPPSGGHSHSTSNPLPFLPVTPSTPSTASPAAYYTSATSHPPLKAMPSLPSFPSAPTSMPKPAAAAPVIPAAASTPLPTLPSVPSTATPNPTTTTPTAKVQPVHAASTPHFHTPTSVPQSSATSSAVPPLKPPPSSHVTRVPSNPIVSPSRPQSKPPSVYAPPTPSISPASSSDSNASFDGGVTLSIFAAPSSSSSTQPRPVPSGKPALPEVLAAVKDLTAAAEKLRLLVCTRYAKLASGSAAERAEIGELGTNLDVRTRTLADLQQWLKTDDLQMKFLRSALKGVVTAGTGLATVARTPHFDPQESAARLAASSVANHQSALQISVKSVIQACEMLTAKGQQVYLPADWQPPRPEEPPRRLLPVTPARVAPPPFDAKKIDLRKYDLKKVVLIQKYWRSYLVRKRFRELLIALKNDKSSELSRRRQRQKVLKEIEDTERVFVTDLGLCVKHFVVPLRLKASEGKFFDGDSWSQLNDSFKHLETVYALNVELFDNIKKCMAAVPVGRGLGDAFSKMVPRLQPYSDYINSYDTAVKVIDKAKKKDSALATFLQQCMAASGARLDLESYLIKPVQRLPRYQLLLKELIKFTGSDHLDLPGLSEAVLRIAQRVDGMNKSKRQKDNTDKLGSLQSQIAGLPTELADPDRYYVKEAPLDVLLPGESQPELMTVIMLSDALLFTTPRSSKERPYQFVDLCHLHDVEIVERPGGFAVLHSPTRTEWRCTAKNEADRLGWLNDLKQQLELNAIKDMVNCTHHTATFRIVHATYGKLSDPIKCKDVTIQLQQISAFQGGKGLELKAEPKSKFLGDPAGSLTSKQLYVMYSANGQDLSVSFNDSDHVSLPQK